MRTTYRYRDGEWVDKDGNRLIYNHNMEPCAPMVIRDIPDYASPVTGEMITSRSWRREDLKKHDCYEVDPPSKPRGLKNVRFAKKHKAKHLLSEEARPMGRQV